MVTSTNAFLKDCGSTFVSFLPYDSFRLFLLLQIPEFPCERGFPFSFKCSLSEYFHRHASGAIKHFGGGAFLRYPQETLKVVTILNSFKCPARRGGNHILFCPPGFNLLHVGGLPDKANVLGQNASPEQFQAFLLSTNLKGALILGLFIIHVFISSPTGVYQVLIV